MADADGKCTTTALGDSSLPPYSLALSHKRAPQPSTASRVFGIFELAEQILDELPVHDLILIANTSTTIRSPIDNSNQIAKRIKPEFLRDFTAECVEGDSWSKDLRFEARFTVFDPIQACSAKVFLTQKGQCEAVGVIHSRDLSRLRIVDGRRVKIEWCRKNSERWVEAIQDNELGRMMSGNLLPSVLYPKGVSLLRYLIRFHGGAGYEEADRIRMIRS